MDYSLPGSSVLGILQARMLEGVAISFSKSESLSVVSNSATLGLYGPWNSPSQNTGMGSNSLLQLISPTKELNQGLLDCRQILHQLSYQGSPCRHSVK